MLACDQTITLIRCNGEAYTTSVINNVSWYDKSEIKLVGNGFSSANITKIRIPRSSIGENFVMPKKGDYVVHGLVTKSINSPADMAEYDPRRIMSVGDNRRGGLPHLAVICE